jgi:6-phosphofructokinase
MGDRVAANALQKKERPAEVEEMMERAQKKRQKRDRNHDSVMAAQGGSSKKHNNILMSSGGQSILDLGHLQGYQPTHAGSRASYEALLVRLEYAWNIDSVLLQYFSFCLFESFNSLTFYKLKFCSAQ